MYKSDLFDLLIIATVLVAALLAWSILFHCVAIYVGLAKTLEAAVR